MLRKSFFLIFGLFLFSALLTPAHAQKRVINPLNDIKTRLEEGGISVVDYSRPENEWGSLTPEWIRILIDKDVENIKEVADQFSADFEGEGGISAMRYQLGVLEGKKTRADTEAKRQAVQEQIEELSQEILDAELSVRQALTNLAQPPEDSPATLEEGVELLFNEIDFYYNYNRWGRSSYLIGEALKAANIWGGEEERDLTALGRAYQDLSAGAAGTNFGMDVLREDLATVVVTDLNGNQRGLTATEIDVIVQDVLATRFQGERQLTSVARSVLNFIRNLIAGVAVIIIVIAGARMVFAQGEENVIEEQKKTITYALIGLAAILLVDRLVDLLYGPAELRTELLTDESYNLAFDLEVYGLVSFLRAVVGMIAIFFIVKAGLLSIFAQGEEDKLTQQKKAIIYTVVGLIIIAVDRAVVENIFIQPVRQDDRVLTYNVVNLVNTIGYVLQFFLYFLGLITLGILVYGAGLMLLNLGNEEMVTKGKTIVKNAIIGIIVIIAAYTIVATLVIFR